MWKVIFLFLFVINSFAQNEHFDIFKKKYPYAILTEDYGILNENDLKIGQCHATPQSFHAKGFNPYPYWQCFSTQQTHFECEIKLGTKKEMRKNSYAMLVITANKDNEIHEYISRRPILKKDCRFFFNEWKKLTHNENYICISGMDANLKLTPNTNAKKYSWIYDRFKTKKGCQSYFNGMCNIDFWKQEECEIKLENKK